TAAHGARRPRSIRAARARARAATVADLARGAPAAADVQLKRGAVAQVAAVGDDAPDQGALRIVGDEPVDQVDLVHGDELQDLAAHLAGGAAWHLCGHLQELPRPPGLGGLP